MSRLPLVAPADALAALLEGTIAVSDAERVPLHRAHGRILAERIDAAEDLPPHARALMDGFAIRGAEALHARRDHPHVFDLAGEVLMGTVPKPAASGAAYRIHTGALMPPGTDTVIALEDATSECSDDSKLVLDAPVELFDNVLQVGEDTGAGPTVLVPGLRLRVFEVGALATLGCADVMVWRRPRIAILSTGDEVIPVDAPTRPAHVRDCNSYTIAATVEAAGGIAIRCGIVRDDAVALAAGAAEALAGADALVISAGSSASHRDITAAAIAGLGSPGILAHGLAIRPGKPAIVALCDGKPVIGLPGNPAAATALAWRLVRPLVRALSGERGDRAAAVVTLDAVLTGELPSQAGREEFVPCLIDYDASPPRAQPLLGESHLTFAYVRCDGLAFVPLGCAGLAAGEHVRIIV